MKNMYFELNTSEDPQESFYSRNAALIEIVNEDDSQRNSGNSNMDQFAKSKENGKSFEDFSLWDPENKRFIIHHFIFVSVVTS